MLAFFLSYISFSLNSITTHYSFLICSPVLFHVIINIFSCMCLLCLYYSFIFSFLILFLLPLLSFFLCLLLSMPVVVWTWWLSPSANLYQNSCMLLHYSLSSLSPFFWFWWVGGGGGGLEVEEGGGARAPLILTFSACCCFLHFSG